MGRTLLYYACKPWVFGSSIDYPPVSLIVIGNWLKERGFEVEIKDARIHDPQQIDYSKYDFLGISAMTGTRIAKGLEISKLAKKQNPGIKTVWGGVHASLLPQQTLENELVDFVVRGEGEMATQELVEGKDLFSIKNLSFKTKDGIVHNEDRPFMNLDLVDEVNYDLIEDPKRYAVNETFHYPSARGCPHRCYFCYNLKFCGSTWRTKSIKKIRKDLDYVFDRYDPKRLNFLEDNFFPSKEKVGQVCDYLIERKFQGTWNSDCRAEYFRKFDDEFMKKLKASGCNNLNIGCESGSQKVLDKSTKDIKVEDCYNALQKCEKYGISVFGFFIIGFPFENYEDIKKTLDLIDEFPKLNKKAFTNISVLSPYPETVAYDEAIKSGFKPPQSLEEWGKWIFSSNQAQWVPKEHRDMLETIALVSRLRVCGILPKSASPKQFLKELLTSPFAASAKLRWRLRFFKYPLEWKLWQMMVKRRGYF